MNRKPYKVQYRIYGVIPPGKWKPYCSKATWEEAQKVKEELEAGRPEYEVRVATR